MMYIRLKRYGNISFNGMHLLQLNKNSFHGLLKRKLCLTAKILWKTTEFLRKPLLNTAFFGFLYLIHHRVTVVVSNICLKSSTSSSSHFIGLFPQFRATFPREFNSVDGGWNVMITDRVIREYDGLTLMSCVSSTNKSISHCSYHLVQYIFMH